MAEPVISMQVVSKDTEEKKVTTTVTYVNASASNALLKEFAYKLVALTNNTYDSAYRITKEEIL